MRSRLKLKHKGLILVCVPLLFEIGFVGVLTYKHHEAEVETDKEARAREIVTLSFRLGHSFYAIGWNLASYAQKQDQQSAENFRQGLAALERDRSHLLKLIEEEPYGLEKYRRFEKVLLVAENTCRRIETVMQGGLEFGEVLSMRGQLELIIQKLAQRQREFVEGYEKIQEQSPGKQRSIRENQRVVLLGALLFNVALTVVLALFFARSITGRLGVLTENTRRLALEQELAPQLTGSDEIADLDRVFHQMADGLRDAAEKERALLRHTHDVICSLDIDGKFSKINPACKSVWGYDEENLLGRQVFGYLSSEEDMVSTRAALDKLSLVIFRLRIRSNAQTGK